MTASVDQRVIKRKASTHDLLPTLVEVRVDRLLRLHPFVQPAPPQPGGQQRQHGKQRALPLPADRQQPDDQPGNHRGNPAPQQITVAAKHLGGQQ